MRTQYIVFHVTAAHTNGVLLTADMRAARDMFDSMVRAFPRDSFYIVAVEAWAVIHTTPQPLPLAK